MARIGWVVPSWNTVTEYEVPRLTPAGGSNHFTRIRHTEDSEAAFAAMVAEGPGAVELLAHAGLDAVVFACTAATFFRGRAAEEDLRTQLRDVAGAPVVTMGDALVDALRHLGAERVVVAAPYEQWLGDRLVEYVREAGLEVLASAFLGEQANVQHGPEEARQLAVRAWRDGADAILISCGNFRTMESIQPIENELGVPVVTSIGAAAWASSRAAGLRVRDDAPGQLFSSAPKTVAAVQPERSS